MERADLLYSGLMFAAEGMVLLWTAVLLTAAVVVLGPSARRRAGFGPYTVAHGVAQKRMRLFLADQVELITDEEHFEEQRDAISIEGGNEVGDGGEVGFGVGGQGHEDYVLIAAVGDPSARRDPFGIGVEDDL